MFLNSILSGIVTVIDSKYGLKVGTSYALFSIVNKYSRTFKTELRLNRNISLLENFCAPKNIE
jgi:hypothetical protein